jgi:hypothetical protein
MRGVPQNALRGFGLRTVALATKRARLRKEGWNAIVGRVHRRGPRGRCVASHSPAARATSTPARLDSLEDRSSDRGESLYRGRPQSSVLT